MIIQHVHTDPGTWQDTNEPGVIQPSDVIGLAHSVELSPEEVAELTGPQGIQGPAGPAGAAGPQGPAGSPIVAAGAVGSYAMLGGISGQAAGSDVVTTGANLKWSVGGNTVSTTYVTAGQTWRYMNGVATTSSTAPYLFLRVS